MLNRNPRRAKARVTSLEVGMMIILWCVGIFLFVYTNSYSKNILNYNDIYKETMISSTNKTNKKTLEKVSVSSELQSDVSDGTFNSLPVIYRKRNQMHSTYSCIGENFRDDAWFFRSCSFRNLCFDTSDRTFVIFQSPEQSTFQQSFAKQDILHTHSSSTGNLTVSIGGINPKWQGARKKLKWFPKVLSSRKLEEDGYYELPQNSVWIPFHSFAGHNVGHLVWDDFFPIFKLLTLFHFLSAEGPNDKEDLLLVLTKVELKLWGTCDWNPAKIPMCIKNFNKFLPAMGVANDTFSSQNMTQLNTIDEQKSNFVCAPRGAAGMGMLTDHGLKMHGWDDEDYETTHNAGRGPVFYQFRNFLLQNLGISSRHLSGPPFKLLFSRFSSNTRGRVVGFGKQEVVLKKSFSPEELQVSSCRMSDMTLYDQANITSDAAIFVTVVGGGAMTATFLPYGSSLIAIYESKGGRKRNKETNRPARLDWDVLNHASHIRVHWLPIETFDHPASINFFRDLVRHELIIIKSLI